MSKSLKMIIEALLFSSDKPLTVKDIHDCLPDAEKSEIKNSIRILTHDYDALERSFVLKEVAGGYQFRSRPEYGSYILRMFQKTPNRLSRATVETLAIIAYKQPILRSEIERLRGVDVGGIIKTLMEKGLIKIMGRRELPGRPLVYGTTKKFLEVFDLKDLKSLPKLKEIKDFAADQYEPTIMNRDGSRVEAGTAGEGAGDEGTEEDTVMQKNQAGESPETVSDADNVPAETADTEEESSEDSGISESPPDPNTEDMEISEPEADTDFEEEYIPESPEDIPEEDDPVKNQEISAPEDDVEPEENETED